MLLPVLVHHDASRACCGWTPRPRFLWAFPRAIPPHRSIFCLTAPASPSSSGLLAHPPRQQPW